VWWPGRIVEAHVRSLIPHYIVPYRIEKYTLCMCVCMIEFFRHVFSAVRLGVMWLKSCHHSAYRVTISESYVSAGEFFRVTVG
jgi:hypothetical protein